MVGTFVSTSTQIMFLSIATTGPTATDLGWLLHKRPDKVQPFKTTGGVATVFYPEASDNRCTATLLLDIDPIMLVRGDGVTLDQYVNDRPYVASSLMSSAIATVYSSAMNGRCNDRPELPDMVMPLTATVSVVKVRAAADTLNRLFEPLGYSVTATRHPLDERFPDWGLSSYWTLTISGTLTVKELLAHLYVLLPILDNEKHYFVNHQEVDVLLKKGEGWLANHPERSFIMSRYLRRKESLMRMALDRLTTTDDAPSEDELTELVEGATQAQLTAQGTEPEAERRFVTLHEQRLKAAFVAIKASGAKSVIDLGCGEGKMLRMLNAEPQYTRLAGMDVSYRELLRAKDRIHYDHLNQAQRDRLTLFQGSLLYRDARLNGFDAAALVEVIEHVEPERLPDLERVVFAFARPQTVVVTTPNVEYNQKYGMTDSQSRHDDHRFEWTRAEFAAWCQSVCARFTYTVTITGIGEADDVVGASSQMAVFKKI